MKSNSGLVLGALLALLLGVAPVLAQAVSFDFMPKGGKTLLLRLLGTPPDTGELHKITAARRDEEGWTKILTPKKDAISDNELRTLANYLAVNMPLAEGALVAAAVLHRDVVANGLAGSRRGLGMGQDTVREGRRHDETVSP